MLWFGGIDDRVCVEVENALLELFQVRVKLELGVTGGEGGDEDVNSSVVGLVFFEVGIDDFEGVVVGESDLTYVVEGVRYQCEEMVCRVNSFGGGLVEVFAELAPEAVQHEFGSGFPSWILLDETGVEVDTFFLFVEPDELFFFCGCDSPSGVPYGLLFDLQPGVDVFGEETYFASFRREVVNFMDLE